MTFTPDVPELLLAKAASPRPAPSWPAWSSPSNAPAGSPRPEKLLTEYVAVQRQFLGNAMRPASDAAAGGIGHVLFVDAAQFDLGTCPCCLRSILRVCVRAASGRLRFNALRAWNAVTRQLLAVNNTTVVSTETTCELVRAIAAEGLVGPVTVVLDNARY